MIGQGPRVPSSPRFARRGLAGGLISAAIWLGVSGTLGPVGWPGAAGAVEPVAEDDPRIEVSTDEYPSEIGFISAYIAKPAGGENLPAVILLHDSRGLNDHFKDLARRLAVEDFLVVAPDILSPLGGTPDDPEWARQMVRELDRQQALANFRAALPYAEMRPDSSGKVGCVGFAWGGGMAARMAVNDPGLAAAAVYYGSAPPSEAVPRIQGRLLLHYAGADERTNADIPGFLGALTVAGTDFELFVYDDMERSFADESTPSRYDEDAANLAWQRTVDFLNESLR